MSANVSATVTAGQAPQFSCNVAAAIEFSVESARTMKNRAGLSDGLIVFLGQLQLLLQRLERGVAIREADILSLLEAARRGFQQ